MSESSPDAKISCSFCGQGEDDVAKIISGPSCFICSGCVTLSMDMLVADTRQLEACKTHVAELEREWLSRGEKVVQRDQQIAELQAQLDRANASLEDWKQRAGRMSLKAKPLLDRATKPRADENARQTWAELQRLRRRVLSFGRNHLSADKFYSPENVLSEALWELGRLRNRDGTLGRIATALGMEYVSDNAISDNRDLRVYRAVMELHERATKPGPMSEAVFCTGTHQHSFRPGEYAEVVGVEMFAPEGLTPRPVFVLRYADGTTDEMLIASSDYALHTRPSGWLPASGGDES